MGGYLPKGHKPPKPPVWRLGPEAMVRIYPAVSSRDELAQYNAGWMHEYAIALDLGFNKKRADYCVYWWQFRNGEWSKEPMPLSMGFIYLRGGSLHYDGRDYPEYGDYCAYLTNKVIDKTDDADKD